MANVTLKGVYKVYDNSVVPAVYDFNLDIKDKEFVVFVGPSGCGKSTTLRMVAGLEDITLGEIYIDGKLINDVEPKDRDIAMVFQNYALYPHMTVYKNIAFALRFKGVEQPVFDKEGNPVLDKDGNPVVKRRKYTKREIDDKVLEAARILEIEDYLERKPKALSGGQRQRVAIGRAIVRKPKVFLMDEPLSNLDAKLRNQMRTEILELRRKVETTFIYVTHDQVEAMTLGDRIVIMKDGYMQQVGTPTEVFYKPANIFVAGFIGAPQMNFFDAELKKDGDYYVELLGKRFELSKQVKDKLEEKSYAPAPITLGVRPEHITLVEDPENGVEAKSTMSEMMGSEVHTHLEAGAVKLIVRVPVVGTEDSVLSAVNECGTVYFTFAPRVMHLFDKQTGENIIYAGK